MPSIPPPPTNPPSLPPPNFDPVAVLGIASVYDRFVAEHYDEDAFGIIASSRALALAQMRAIHALKPGLLVCDFGVGTGECLLAIDAEHEARAMWGVDVSARMLDLARSKLQRRGRMNVTKLLESCATQVAQQLPPRGMDVAVSHFLLNYVDHANLARAVSRTVRPDGLWSIVTSQRDSFPVLADLGRTFLPAAYDPDRHCSVPTSTERFEALVESHGFELVRRDRHTCPIRFDRFDQALHFARHSGWFASDIVESVPEDVIATLRGSIAHTFPVVDEARVAVLLFRRR